MFASMGLSFVLLHLCSWNCSVAFFSNLSHFSIKVLSAPENELGMLTLLLHPGMALVKLELFLGCFTSKGCLSQSFCVGWLWENSVLLIVTAWLKFSIAFSRQFCVYSNVSILSSFSNLPGIKLPFYTMIISSHQGKAIDTCLDVDFFDSLNQKDRLPWVCGICLHSPFSTFRSL